MPKPLSELTFKQAKQIKWLLTDVDDTLTWEGKLPAETLQALSKLNDAGVNIIPVTGACAGWCDQMARLWPVHGVIGENGAFWMQKNAKGFASREMTPITKMRQQQSELMSQLDVLLEGYPDVTYAYDQRFRFCDVAINLSQDRAPVAEKISEELLDRVKQLKVDGQSVNAALSSIHLNVWVGDHSKRLTAEKYLLENNGIDSIINNEIAYIGDSFNDESMFAWLPLTFGVKNILPVLPKLTAKPAYLTDKKGGYGFVELADIILQAKQSTSVKDCLSAS
jgi:HAD superfamily hydrolase (TIGR01484 family)